MLSPKIAQNYSSLVRWRHDPYSLLGSYTVKLDEA